MLSFLWVILIVYLVFRLFNRIMGPTPKIPPGKKPNPAKNPFSQPGRGATVIDEMVPCASCGTYNPMRQALTKNGLYFCNEQCHEAFQKRESV